MYLGFETCEQIFIGNKLADSPYLNLGFLSPLAKAIKDAPQDAKLAIMREKLAGDYPSPVIMRAVGAQARTSKRIYHCFKGRSRLIGRQSIT